MIPSRPSAAGYHWFSGVPDLRRGCTGGRYSPAFALEVALDKYLYHLPLERQVHRMRQQGLYVTPQTLWDQLAALGETLRPTYEAIRRTILESPVVLADETTWRVNESGRIDPKRSWYVWAAANDSLVHYRIDDNRGAEAARALLSGYRGTVMSDGYAVYAKLAQQEGLTAAHCWAHVRRKFVEAEANFPTEAGEALARIRALYAIEERAKGLGPDARRKMRQAEAKPLVEDFFTWLDTLKVLPQSGLGKAIAYSKQLREGLSVYLDDAAVPIDNNACERALRGIVVGRKNHYGSRSRHGTEVAAIIYTLVESAKLSGVSPHAYLEAALEKAIDQPGAVLLPAELKNS